MKAIIPFFSLSRVRERGGVRAFASAKISFGAATRAPSPVSATPRHPLPQAGEGLWSFKRLPWVIHLKIDQLSPLG